MKRFPVRLLLLSLAFGACENSTDPGDPGTSAPGRVTMTALADLPRAGGDVADVAIDADGRTFAIIDGQLYTMGASGGDPQIFNSTLEHRAIGIAPNGDLYAVVGAELRVYNGVDGTFRSAPIDPAGPFATNGRIEEAEFAFSPAGEPYVRIISNYPRTYIYRTSDNGATWQNMNLPPAFAYAGGLAFSPNGDMLMSSTFGFYRSSDRGATWTTSPAPRSGYGGALLAAANGDIYHYPPGGGGLKVSRDGGASFIDLSEFNRSPFFLDIVQGADAALYALASRAGVTGAGVASSPVTLLRSTDGGATWMQMLFAQGRQLAVRGSRIAVGLAETMNGEGGGIYLTTNGGTTWSSYGLGRTGEVTDVGFDRNGNLMVLAGSGIYRRVGTEWQTLGSQQNIFQRFATTSQGAMLLANTTEVYHSSDDGLIWSNSPLENYRPSTSGSPSVVSLLGLTSGDFLFTINNISTQYGPTNGHLYRVGSNGRPARVTGATQTFSSIIEERSGMLHGIEQTLDGFSQTYAIRTYRSSDAGSSWSEVANAPNVPLAVNSRNRAFTIGGSGIYHLQAPGSGEKTELALDGFSSQTNYISRALFGPDDRLYLVTTDKGLFISSGPVR